LIPPGTPFPHEITGGSTEAGWTAESTGVSALPAKARTQPKQATKHTAKMVLKRIGMILPRSAIFAER